MTPEIIYAIFVFIGICISFYALRFIAEIFILFVMCIASYLAYNYAVRIDEVYPVIQPLLVEYNFISPNNTDKTSVIFCICIFLIIIATIICFPLIPFTQERSKTKVVKEYEL